MKKLDFIVIGASKSGTTSLSEHLRSHPQIFIPADKGAPFFTSKRSDAQSWQDFASEYYAAGPEDKLWGKVTPKYMENLAVPGRLSALLPDCKLIAILRNPLDRTFSHYRQQVRRNKENREFSEALKQEVAKTPLTEARDLSRFSDIASFHPVRSHYGFILKQYLSKFRKDQLLVVYLEHLEKNPQQVISAVLNHIGLDSEFVPGNIEKRYHVGGSKQRFPRLVSTLRSIPPLRWAWRALPRHKRSGFWRWFFTEINVIPEKGSDIPQDFRKQMLPWFQEDLRELQSVTESVPPWPELVRRHPSQQRSYAPP